MQSEVPGDLLKLAEVSGNLYGGRWHQVLRLLGTPDTNGCHGRADKEVGAHGLDLAWAEGKRTEESFSCVLRGQESPWLARWVPWLGGDLG